jgi:hypothetical protein
MDPIHPIVPLSPSLPPVAPAPSAGRVDRDGARGDAYGDKRRRRRPDAGPAARADVDGIEYVLEDGDDDDQSGLHISVTA